MSATPQQREAYRQAVLLARWRRVLKRRRRKLGKNGYTHHTMASKIKPRPRYRTRHSR